MRTHVFAGVLALFALFGGSAFAACHETNEHHARFEVSLSMGGTVWFNHSPEATFGLVVGHAVSRDGCWWLRGAVELYKPIGIHAPGLAGIVSLTRRVHRLAEVGFMATALMPLSRDAYHNLMGADHSSREHPILAGGPQLRVWPGPLFPTAVISPLLGYGLGKAVVAGVSVEFEFDITGLFTGRSVHPRP